MFESLVGGQGEHTEKTARVNKDEKRGRRSS